MFKKHSKTPAADLRMPTKEELDALSKAAGVPTKEILADAPPEARAALSSDFEDEDKTEAGKPSGSCPVCGLVTPDASCPIDGTQLKGR